MEPKTSESGAAVHLQVRMPLLSNVYIMYVVYDDALLTLFVDRISKYTIIIAYLNIEERVTTDGACLSSIGIGHY